VRRTRASLFFVLILTLFVAGGTAFNCSLTQAQPNDKRLHPGAILKGIDFSKADLSNADLRKADLSGANLSGANLSGAQLSGAKLVSTNLSGALLVKTNLQQATLNGCNLQGADLRQAILTEAKLKGADLTGANLTGTNLNSVNLSNAKLRAVNLKNANLSLSNLRNADFSKANLEGADLNASNLREANLSGANLARANLSFANLIQANLGGADLSQAQLKGARLTGTNFSGAKFNGTVLVDADLKGAKITEAQLAGAILKENIPDEIAVTELIPKDVDTGKTEIKKPKDKLPKNIPKDKTLPKDIPKDKKLPKSIIAKTSGNVGIDDSQWGLMASLAFLSTTDPVPPREGIEDHAFAWDKTPREWLHYIDEEIAAVPYQGAMISPLEVWHSKAANTLDRARLLKILIELGGDRARIVYVKEAGSKAFVLFRQGSWDELNPPAEDLRPVLEEEIREWAPQTWKAICGGPRNCDDWKIARPGSTGTRDIYWVQLKEGNRWVDLIPDDTHIDSELKTRTQVLTAKKLSRLTWTIEFQVLTQYGGSGKSEHASLKYRADASSLHGMPITYFNQPEGSLEQFAPTLVVGEKVIKGKSFKTLHNKQPLTLQSLKIEVKGPGESYQHTRQLVGPPKLANPGERGLEIATKAQITIASGQVSVEDYDRSILNNLHRAAQLYFADERFVISAEKPLNLPSIRALTLLRVSRALAGTLGKTSRKVVAYQGRPAIVIEHEYMEASAKALVRKLSLDFVDPGHALYCRDCPDSMLRLAAIEQSIVDGQLEDWVVLGQRALTSYQVNKDLMGSTKTFNSGKPSHSTWSDSFGGSKAVYRLAPEQKGKWISGWRLDPGPQAVPIITGGLGGTISVQEQRERLKTFCKYIDYATVLIPMSVLPADFLLSPIIAHQCRVAEAFNKSADILNLLFSDNPNNDELNKKIKELESGIKGMGTKFATDLATSIVSQVVVGGAFQVAAKKLLPAIKDVLSVAGETVKEFIEKRIQTGVRKQARELAEKEARKLAQKEGRKLTEKEVRELTEKKVREMLNKEARELAEQEVEKATARKARQEMGELVKEMEKAGWTKKQRREFFEKYGCFIKGTPVLTPQGSRAIDSLEKGDLVLSKNLATGTLESRKVVRTIKKWAPVCLVIQMKNGDHIETTPTHPIYLPDKKSWVSAESLSAGMWLSSVDGHPSVVESMSSRVCGAPSYDLEVEENHNYFVSDTGVLVHNNNQNCKPNTKTVKKGLKTNEPPEKTIKKLKPNSPETADAPKLSKAEKEAAESELKTVNKTLKDTRGDISKLKKQETALEKKIRDIENRPGGPSKPKSLTKPQKDKIKKVKDDELKPVRKDIAENKKIEQKLKAEKSKLHEKLGTKDPKAKANKERLAVESDVIKNREGMKPLRDGFPVFDGVKKPKVKGKGKSNPPDALQVKTVGVGPDVKTPAKWKTKKGQVEILKRRMSQYKGQLNSDQYKRAQKEFNASNLSKEVNKMPDNWKDMNIEFALEVGYKKPKNWKRDGVEDILKDEAEKMFGKKVKVNINFRK
jgi:uncharacterized protein YjbI with pentapeptide repeats